MPTPSQIKKLEGILDSLIKQRYLKYFQLPQDLRQLMFDIETADKVRKVGEKNNLNKDQLWWASYTVGMILLGETNIVKFVKTLQEKCGLAEEPARQLARDINQTIFLPVKESLKKIHQVPEWPREEEAVKIPEKSIPQLTRKNTYQEPVEEPPEPGQVEPRIEGNVVDLKNK